MLISLEIKDYALIQNIRVEFEKGLNIITGETGAGKSILIGALGLLLGERASSESVRKGAKKSFVEGIFDIGANLKVTKFLSTNDIEPDNEIIVRREISLKGSNRCFINDTPVQLALIKQVGNLLIDLHGQHDHQSLLSIDTHIDFLDEFCDLQDDLELYNSGRIKLGKILSEIKRLKENEKNLKDKLELNKFQLKEISAVSPEKDEDIKLEKELNILENAENLFQTSEFIYDAIYGEDNSVHDLIINVKNRIDEISKIDTELKSKGFEIESALEQIKDVGDFIRDYKDKIEIDPNRTEEIRDRVGAIHLLKKKYGGSLDNVLKFQFDTKQELSLAENFSDKILQLENEASQNRTKLKKYALILHDKRKYESVKIEKEIIKSLNYLGITDSKFKIMFNMEENNTNENYVTINNKKINLSSNGVDVIEFFISTNMGEDLKPLAKTASGGEISRVMLAIKSVLAKTEKLPLLIFDEIDTGVSGRIAQKVGSVLKELSSSHQIISITHLPQIAAYADHHFTVQKETNSHRVISYIKKLDADQKIMEVAKLLSGENISQANIDAAKELIEIVN